MAGDSVTRNLFAALLRLFPGELAPWSSSTQTCHYQQCKAIWCLVILPACCITEDVTGQKKSPIVTR